MKTLIPKKNTLALILLIAGVLLGVTLSILSTWADFEAEFYGFSKQNQTPLAGLYCPILMTNNESQTISVTIKNKTTQIISPSIKAEFSTPLTPVSTLDFFDLGPGESHTLKWKVGPQNVDLGQFIFAQVLVYSAYPMPNQEGRCGIFVLPVRGNGTWILVITTIVSVLSLCGAVYLFSKSDLPAQRSRSAIFLASIVLLTLVVSFLSLWMFAILLIAITLLTTVTILSARLGQGI